MLATIPNVGRFAVETDAQGRLFVTANLMVAAFCEGAPVPAARIAVDGAPVPSSLRGLVEADGALARREVTVSGVTEEEFPAGPHTITVQVGCSPDGGDGGVGYENFFSASAVVLGN